MEGPGNYGRAKRQKGEARDAGSESNEKRPLGDTDYFLEDSPNAGSYDKKKGEGGIPSKTPKGNRG